MTNFFLRSTDILQPMEGLKLTVVGAGGIGSNLVFLLAKLGFPNIRVYDDDIVSEENIGPQLFRLQDLGKPKVQAIAEIVKEFLGVDIEAIQERKEQITKEADTSVLLLGVDNMESRKKLVEKSSFDFCIDGRMGGETFNIFSFYAHEKERYLATVFPDSEAVFVPCTARAVGYNTFGIAAMMANVVKKFNNMEDGLPFEQNFCFKTLSYCVA